MYNLDAIAHSKRLSYIKTYLLITTGVLHQDFRLLHSMLSAINNTFCVEHFIGMEPPLIASSMEEKFVNWHCTAKKSQLLKIFNDCY